MMKKFFVWISVFLAIAVNHTFLKDQSFRQNIPFLENIRYSDFLVQKWFLVAVAFSVFTIWVLMNRENTIYALRKNIIYILIIAIVTLGVHWLSFERWFEFDDYRLIGHHRAVTDTPQYNTMGALNNPYYGYAFAYLVVRWFDATFELYNGLGLSILFLIGIVIFAIGNKIQKNKLVSLSAALFFVTSPTYFRQILQMHEFLGDSFPLLLFTTSTFFAISRFYAESVIFAASALEFGLSREHFIGVPLFLIVLFFAKKEASFAKRFLIASIFPLISLLYLPVLRSYPPQIISKTNLIDNWPQLVRIADTIFGVSIPHLIAYVLNYISIFLQFPYLSPLFGAAIVMIVSLTVIVQFLKKKFLVAKLLIIGLSISVGAVFFPTLMGIRLEHNLSALSNQYRDFIPSSPTSYGLPSAFGLAILIIALNLMVRPRLFAIIVITLIFINSLSVYLADREWIRQVAFPQRVINKELADIIPYDGKVKIVYTPYPSEILSRHVSYFYQLYRIKDRIYEMNDAGELIKLIDKHKPNKESVFLLTYNKKTYEVYDYSGLVRSHYPSRITLSYLNSLQSVIEELDVGKN